MKYERDEIVLLVAELRRFSEAVIGGPHVKAADVLLDLWDDLDRQQHMLNEYRHMYLLKSRENERFRKKLNLQSLPLLRNTAAANMDELIQLHNAARQKTNWVFKKPPPLQKDADFMAYAQAHANWMADKDVLQHSAISAIMKLGFSTAGENIAWGQQTAERVMQSWLWSPGHRRNIMSGSYTHIGCGASLGPNDRLYWCVCFGSK